MAERIPGARRRMLSTRISLSKKVASVSWAAEAIYTRIIPHADDAGGITADLEELRATVIPMGKGGKPVPLKSLRGYLEELHNAGLIVLYSEDGDDYLRITKWEAFQTVQKDRNPTVLTPDIDEQNVWNPMQSNVIPNGSGSGSGKSNGSGKKEVSLFSEEFEEWWQGYPNKQGKTNARFHYTLRRKNGATREELIQARDSYVAKKDAEENPVYSNGSTFLNPSPPSNSTSATIDDFIGVNPDDFKKEVSDGLRGKLYADPTTSKSLRHI